MKKGNRAQFYLVTTVIIISILVGFASLENLIQKKNSVKFYYHGEELRLETEKVLDYAIKQNLEGEAGKNLLINFTKDYVRFSDADNFYFIFGNTTNITFVGYQKLKNGTVDINVSSGLILVDLRQREINITNVSGPGASVNITIPGDIGERLTFEFSVKSGENFFFIISKEVGGDRYLETNGFSRESQLFGGGSGGGGLRDLIIFATSERHDGKFDGLSGADSICQGLASSASLPGTYLAWLSTNSVNAKNRVPVELQALPFIMTNGIRVANDLADLTDGRIQNNIDKDENGNTITGFGSRDEVWTGTNWRGTNEGSDCNGWTSNSGRDGNQNRAAKGDTDWTDAGWTDEGDARCDENRRLYCFRVS